MMQKPTKRLHNKDCNPSYLDIDMEEGQSWAHATLSFLSAPIFLGPRHRVIFLGPRHRVIFSARVKSSECQPQATYSQKQILNIESYIKNMFKTRTKRNSSVSRFLLLPLVRLQHFFFSTIKLLKKAGKSKQKISS